MSQQQKSEDSDEYTEIKIADQQRSYRKRSMSIIIQKVQVNQARKSKNSCRRLYVSMRHLLIVGMYEPMGQSGQTLREALLTLQPEIYGSIAEKNIELKGLLYVLDRLPEGIEEC